jgi:hypothetical protein
MAGLLRSELIFLRVACKLEKEYLLPFGIAKINFLIYLVHSIGYTIWQEY